jgi:soluble lytic murein transglycosylase
MSLKRHIPILQGPILQIMACVGVSVAMIFAATPAEARKKKSVTSVARFSAPDMLSASDAALYQQSFAAVRASRFAEAQKLLATTTDPVLRGSVEAEMLLRPTYINRTSADMTLWLQNHPELAQAQRIYALAVQTNASAPKPAELGNRWGLWQTKKPPRPATPLERNTAKLAWDYYSVGQISTALSRAKSVAASPTPEGGFALWVAGLSAWRLNDCAQAAAYFGEAALKPALSNDMLAATNFWAARAEQQCGQFETATSKYKLAAETGDTFYGLLAARVLGVPPSFNWGSTSLTKADWNKLSGSVTVRRIAALAQVGEPGLADEELRNWWGRAPEGQWASLIRLGDSLKLYGAKLSITRRPPAGQRAPLSAYYPVPDWWNDAGATVPKSLVLAFMRQESAFRRDTVSRANARGPMQFLPSTAREIAQDNSITETDERLNDPAYAIRIGKTYLRQLAKSSITDGHLIKVTASYNAGPGNVRNWNASMPQQDPLLYIESIPLTETRDYVETVLKNYWVYQLRLGEPTTTLDSLARGEWPAFPGEKTRFNYSSAATVSMSINHAH